MHLLGWRRTPAPPPLRNLRTSCWTGWGCGHITGSRSDWSKGFPRVGSRKFTFPPSRPSFPGSPPCYSSPCQPTHPTPTLTPAGPSEFEPHQCQHQRQCFSVLPTPCSCLFLSDTSLSLSVWASSLFWPHQKHPHFWATLPSVLGLALTCWSPLHILAFICLCALLCCLHCRSPFFPSLKHSHTHLQGRTQSSLCIQPSLAIHYLCSSSPSFLPVFHTSSGP